MTPETEESLARAAEAWNKFLDENPCPYMQMRCSVEPRLQAISVTARTFAHNMEVSTRSIVRLEEATDPHREERWEALRQMQALELYKEIVR